MNSEPKIAILLPCYNEALAIKDVIAEFKKACPSATVYVYDNNSTDGTADIAKKAGAITRSVKPQGKGFVVQRMFLEIDADIYVMADGDGTYDASYAPKLIDALIAESADMVVGVRKHESEKAYRRGHQLGNKLLTKSVEWALGESVIDMLSGFRVFNRKFVKSFPVQSKGFEIETEITVHALSLHLKVVNIQTPYFDRVEGSSSKLRTFKDGFNILKTIGLLVKYERPMFLFSLIGFGLAVLSLVVGAVVVIEYIETGYVSRIPSAILATGLMLSSLLSFILGVILDSIAHGQKQNKKLHYLSTE